MGSCLSQEVKTINMNKIPQPERKTNNNCNLTVSFIKLA